jgi:hypothetical protein
MTFQLRYFYVGCILVSLRSDEIHIYFTFLPPCILQYIHKQYQLMHFLYYYQLVFPDICFGV